MAETLFQRGEFKLPSGTTTSWQIDCEALSDADIESLAQLAAGRVGNFGRLEYAGAGARRFAEALRKHATSGPVLLAGDVLVTGATMEDYRNERDLQGVVIFARGACPDWVTPLFTLGEVLDRADSELADLKRRIHYWQPAGETGASAAIDDIGSARNSLILRVDELEEKADVIDAAAMALQEWRHNAEQAHEEVPLSVRRWLAAYDALSGRYGC